MRELLRIAATAVRTRGEARLRKGLLLVGFIIWGAGAPAALHAWTWDDDESVTKDELQIQLDAYHKQVDNGLSLQERVLALDQLIKIYQIRKRDTKTLEAERATVIADENAIQTVSTLSRQKAQELFQKTFDSVREGKYQEAQVTVQEAVRLNPTDKMITELSQRLGMVVTLMPTAPSAAVVGDFVRKGVQQFLQGEPQKSLNFLIYAQQQDPTNSSISSLVELVRRTYPNESAELLDAHLNLVDQKLQRALEKIYSGDYLMAAKDCQEVLDLEPDNTLAMTRLGSVYYAMGQVKQARAYWQQALTLDKNNDILKSFMEQTKAEADHAPAQALTYKVEKGDTLQKIAEKVYQSPAQWKTLYEANRTYLKSAYQLSVGQVLVLPPAKP